ncbi:MAG: rod shape-determining protein MreB [Planctomycetota bacterium]|jgi:rod shape-determining protein MreB
MVRILKALVGMLHRWFGQWIGQDIGIDLGTSSTLICAAGKGIILNEPTVVAVDKRTDGVLNKGEAIGLIANEMRGKTPHSIKTIRPLKGGVIGDFKRTEQMLGHFIKKVHRRTIVNLARPRVVVAVPSGITSVERRAVVESAERAGARKVYLVDEPMAAGIGSGLPIVEPTASMIIDIGAGTTEVAILSLADIATCKSLKVGGDNIDEAIIAHLRKTYNLLIGEASAERVKKEIGSASPLEEELTMQIAGRDTISGLPRKIIVTSEEIRDALHEPIGAIVNAVVATLEKTKPELAADLVDNGIHICGGGSLLRGLDRVISTATGLRVTRVEDPMNSVAYGTSMYMENLDLWKDTMEQVN